MAWGCSIGRLSLAVASVLVFGLAATGCSGIPKANPNIAFIGDSITAFWWLPSTNLGVPGNTTHQMLARFPDQVLGHGYAAVVILGGTNDVRSQGRPLQPEIDAAIANLTEMAAMATKENLVVVLCKIPPIRNENARVDPYNQAVEDLARQNNYKLVDYYTPMAGHPEYFEDGLHPNAEGYFVMQAALEKVISLDK